MTAKFLLTIRGDVDAAAVARRALTQHDPTLPPSVKDDVALLVTELVTNAVSHGGATPDRPLQLEFRRRNGTIRVEVVDPGTKFEAPSGAPPPPTNHASGGWGLFFVDRIAERWGVNPAPTGTCVWFELPAARAP
jgi:anti-sigma regulatory factor (Ser/Thr protein kinase)